MVLVRPHLELVVPRGADSVDDEARKHPFAAAFILLLHGFHDSLAGMPLEVADHI